MDTLSDLRKAIATVLNDAIPIEGNGVAHLHGYHSVDSDILRTLQAEYNIYFVEPDDEQLNVI